LYASGISNVMVLLCSVGILLDISNSSGIIAFTCPNKVLATNKCSQSKKKKLLLKRFPDDNAIFIVQLTLSNHDVLVHRCPSNLTCHKAALLTRYVTI